MARNRWFPDDEDTEEVVPPPVLCWLCEREMGETVEWHHPVPKSKGGRDKVPIHPICHQTIHTALTNAELARKGEDVAGLRALPAVAKFLEWVADKPADFHAPTRREGGSRGRGGSRR